MSLISDTTSSAKARMPSIRGLLTVVGVVVAGLALAAAFRAYIPDEQSPEAVLASLTGSGAAPQVASAEVEQTDTQTAVSDPREQVVYPSPIPADYETELEAAQVVPEELSGLIPNGWHWAWDMESIEWNQAKTSADFNVLKVIDGQLCQVAIRAKTDGTTGIISNYNKQGEAVVTFYPAETLGRAMKEAAGC